ncbi:MAG: CHAT domain-containing protein [Thermoanaerobaculia bacterium]
MKSAARLLLAGFLLASPVRAGEAPRPLEPGAAVERELAGGVAHSYTISLAAGDHLLVTVDQRGIDIAIEAFDPAGASLGVIDTPTGRLGPESMLVSAPATGEHRIEVRSPSATATAGRYEIRVEALSAPRRIEAERLATEAKILARQGGAEPARAALGLYGEALKRWRELGDRTRQAEALAGSAGLHASLGEPRQALEDFSRAAEIWEALGHPIQQANALSGMGLALKDVGEGRDALARFERALALYQAGGDRSGEARALTNICFIHQSLGRSAEEVPCYERVLGLFRELGQTRLQALVLLNLGGVYDRMGEPREALARYGQALELLSALGDRRGEAQLRNNVGVIYNSTGEIGEALSHFDRALPIFRELGDRQWEARTLHNLGSAYYALGELQRARTSFEQALALRRAADDRPGQIVSLNYLGLVHHRLGEPATALSLFRQAIELARATGEQLGEANSLSLIGEELLAAGDYRKALEELRKAIEILSALGDRRSRAAALQRTGEAWAGLGDPARALEAFGEALALRRAITDRAGEAGSLTAMAAVLAKLGRWAEARSRVGEALTLIESLRTTVVNPDLRASFLAAHRQAFELEIGLVMQLHRQEPEGGHAREALEVSERARARALLDLLQEAGADVRQGSDPVLRERERVLVERLNAKADRQIERLSRAGGGEAADAERELQSLLAELDGVRAEIRTRSPRYAALTQPVPLRAAEIQALLDPDTLLLEYSLGEKESFLWAVDSKAVVSFELPPRAGIEALARRVYEGMRSVDAGAAPAKGTEGAEAASLSRMLLGPLGGRLAGKRLVIVADGALHYLPFAALPAPDGKGDLLLDRHEIVTLPSATVLAVQRRELGARPPAPRAVAVLADPLFSSLQRLPSTRLEAEKIAALLPAGQVLLALGSRADRAAVLAGELAPFRVVHFATHGLIDARTPELSGLALSQVGEDGKPRDGFLSLADLYNLQLGADLVVLSGCETALGREIRGEGLVGLTQGFLYAGAARVVASLWRVQDRATADLMGRFYQALLREGKRPAAALREAQLAIRSERRWRDPYHWAAFILQGDWR